jgi:hypothetical protein
MRILPDAIKKLVHSADPIRLAKSTNNVDFKTGSFSSRRNTAKSTKTTNNNDIKSQRHF